MVKRITKKRGGASFNGKNTKDVYSLKNDKFFTLDKPAEFKYCCVLGPFGIVYITGKYIETEIDEFKVSRVPLYKIQQNSYLNADVILHRDENTRQISLQYKFIFSITSMYDVIVSGKFLILKNDGKYLKKETKLELGLKISKSSSNSTALLGLSLNVPAQKNEGPVSLNGSTPNGPAQYNEGPVSLNGSTPNDPAPNNEGLALNDPAPNEGSSSVKSLNELPEQDRKYFSSSIENSKSSSYYIMINGTKFFIKTHTLDKTGKNKDSVLYETINILARSTKRGEAHHVNDMVLVKEKKMFIYFKNLPQLIEGFEVFTVSKTKPSMFTMFRSN